MLVNPISKINFGGVKVISTDGSERQLTTSQESQFLNNLKMQLKGRARGMKHDAYVNSAPHFVARNGDELQLRHRSFYVTRKKTGVKYFVSLEHPPLSTSNRNARTALEIANKAVRMCKRADKLIKWFWNCSDSKRAVQLTKQLERFCSPKYMSEILM